MYRIDYNDGRGHKVRLYRKSIDQARYQGHRLVYAMHEASGTRDRPSAHRDLAKLVAWCGDSNRRPSLDIALHPDWVEADSPRVSISVLDRGRDLAWWRSVTPEFDYL